MPEIKLLEFLVELKYLGEEPTAVCIIPSRCALLASDMPSPSCPTSRHDPGKEGRAAGKDGTQNLGELSCCRRLRKWGYLRVEFRVDQSCTED